MQYTHLQSQIRTTSTAERELIRATVSARGIAGETKDIETVSFIFYLKLLRKVIFCLSHRIRFQPVRYLESLFCVCVCVCVCVYRLRECLLLSGAPLNTRM